MLTHRRLTAGTIASFGAGWHTHLAVLRARMQGTDAPTFWVLFNEVAPAYRLAATQLSLENSIAIGE
ncbi:MAG: hypothetical protein KDE47_15545 [Caldilineaceae bacterium]|nr:hypothetical protein [Caldilineaceae bacterium]